ncbi:hypothetical protein K7X08_004099 [Anisodus acutangulus]|uniref:Coatomer subunit zeta n=1 Tax=Anisodus acutangulus TaxID=402998 RepID=A0A9Q1RKA7_9SOLA|nr:hypothetical protein K7X08_004099 [Anisodus acutangulus]
MSKNTRTPLFVLRSVSRVLIELYLSLFCDYMKSVYIVYTVLGDVSIYLVGKNEYDELALSEAIFVITSALKDVCGKPPTEGLFLDKYGKICLCLDEIVWTGLLRIKTC